MRARMIAFQEETGHMYNLEATPAEGTTYRFAKEDAKRYPGILQAGQPGAEQARVEAENAAAARRAQAEQRPAVAIQHQHR